MPKTVLRREDYTVAWIYALPIELAAARLMLDEEHDNKLGDQNVICTLGRILDHNVVIIGLPAGRMGTESAAATAAQVLEKFPSIRFGLMVGIGGGVPSDTVDIRLGDVVVSQPQPGHGGVIQYDFGKTKPNGFERTGYLNAPPLILLNITANLQAANAISENELDTRLASYRHMAQFSRDEVGPDLLFRAEYLHVPGIACEECNLEKLVQRAPRQSEQVRVHYGAIASGNQVMRDGLMRDKLSAELGGVLCFEMEAAGLMNRLPCLVIRGICDYADSHKTKKWQPYAASTAAAYAKEVLSLLPAAKERPTLLDDYGTTFSSSLLTIAHIRPL
jgi:nucleoside phosphorylase